MGKHHRFVRPFRAALGALAVAALLAPGVVAPVAQPGGVADGPAGSDVADPPEVAGGADVATTSGEPDDGLVVDLTPTRRVGQPGAGSATVTIEVGADLAAGADAVTVRLSAGGRATLRSEADRSLPVPPDGTTSLLVDYVVAGGEGSVTALVDVVDASGASLASERPRLYLLEEDDEQLASRNGRTALRVAAFDRHEASSLPEDQRTTQRAELLDGETRTATADVALAAAVAPGADEVGVQGTVRWTDENGVTHPYRFAQVEVWEDDGLLVDERLTTTTTDAAGRFEAVVDNDDGIGQGGRDLFVRPRTIGSGFRVETSGGDTYSLRSPVASDLADGATASFTLVGVETDDTGRAMSVHQAMAAAVPYANRLNGADFRDLDVVYPNGGTGSFFDGAVQIEEADRWDWDTIHHEYGHFVASELGIEDTPGGSHNLGDNLSEARGDKDVGTRLAWGEAWPTYFGLSMQREEAMAGLGVPRVGDDRYQAFEAGGSNIDYSIESNAGGGALGEDNEVAVQRALWDLYDDVDDDGDEDVALGDQAIWDGLDGADPVRMSTGWPAASGGAGVAVRARAGCIASQWGMAPTPTAPAEGAVFADGDAPPTFEWTPGGGGPAFRNDEFVVEFRTGPERRLVLASPLLGDPEFTPTDAQWALITSVRDISWSVRGTQGDAPATGPYTGCPRRLVASQGPGAIIERPGCRADVLPRNDDGSTGVVPLGFDVDFFGSRYDRLWVNNNGNVTFDTSLSTFTPFELLATSRVIVAPFFGDVDTSNVASGVVTYGQTTWGGRDAFCVNWVDVGYYSSAVDRRNSFQLLIVDRSDVAAGDVDLVFNVDQVQWETGSASGGVGGLGGSSARVGYASSGFAAFELEGSGVNGAFLDANTTTGLVHGSLNSTQLGRYVFRVRNGDATGVQVSGTVTDQSGATVTGAPVDVCADSGGCVSSQTNSAGRYAVEPVPAGTYTVRVAAPAGRDLNTAVVSGVGVADADVVVDVVMDGPTAPPPGTSVEPSRDGGSVPVVFYGDSLALRTQACAGGSATWSIVLDGASVASGSLAEDSAGVYSATVPPLRPAVGYAEVVITVSCPDGSVQVVAFDIYIDPSGTVMDLRGRPVGGATVTLLRSDSANGPFEVVPDGSAVMSPANRSNPMVTGTDGRFGWDTIAGYYIVRAEAPGCLNPVVEGETTVESAILPVPPPQLGIELVLDCGEPPTPAALVASLREVVEAIDAGPPGIVTSLSGKLARAEAAIADGDVHKACSNLQAFRNQAGALQEKFLSGVTSDEVIATATEAMDLLGCG